MTPRQVEVLTRYRILLPDGSRRQTNLRAKGPGLFVSDQALDTLFAADTTPGQLWLDWIFFQSGGGPTGVAKRQKALERIKAVWFKDQLQGHYNPTTNKRAPARPMKEVEARWERALSAFTEVMLAVDEDAVDYPGGTFGYARDLPGRNAIYATVSDAVANYLAVETKAAATEAGEATPENCSTVLALLQHTRRIINHYARNDVRYIGAGNQENALVYEDDVISVLVPLTLPALVRYGLPHWPCAHPQQLDSEAALNGQARRLFFDAYLFFKVPMPRTVEAGQVCTLQQLALELPKRPGSIPDNTLVRTEAKGQVYTLEWVKATVRNDPLRLDAVDADEDVPVSAGAPIVKSNEEAEEIIRHLDLALAALAEWRNRATDKIWQQFRPDLTQMPPD